VGTLVYDPAPSTQLGDRLGCGSVGLRFDVRIVACHRLVGVPEGLAPDLRVNLGVTGQARCAVPAFVQLVALRAPAPSPLPKAYSRILGPGLAVLDPRLPPALAARSPLAWKDLIRGLDRLIDHGLAPV
jgi:hypothetical protein